MCRSAASPITLASKWGMMPSVQPIAANTLARQPRNSPVETVNTTPVPGIRTTINEVSRNSVVIMGGSGPFASYALLA